MSHRSRIIRVTRKYRFIPALMWLFIKPDETFENLIEDYRRVY